MYNFLLFDSKRNPGCIRKVQKGEMEGVGMVRTLVCEKRVKDHGTVAQIGSSKDKFH